MTQILIPFFLRLLCLHKRCRKCYSVRRNCSQLLPAGAEFFLSFQHLVLNSWSGILIELLLILTHKKKKKTESQLEQPVRMEDVWVELLWDLEDPALTVSMWVIWLSWGQSRLSPSMCQISCGMTRSAAGQGTGRHYWAWSPEKKAPTECDHYLHHLGFRIHFEDGSKSLYVVLFSSNKLAPGFPSFHLRGDMGLFRAKMDVLALPVWHPKALSHVILHIKSWCGRQIPRPRRLYIRANVRYGLLDGAAQSPPDRYKSSMCLSAPTGIKTHVEECVRHIMGLMNDPMAVTWTKLQNTEHTLKIHGSCGGFLPAAGMSR